MPSSTTKRGNGSRYIGLSVPSLRQGLRYFQSANKADADFFFGKYGNSFHDAVH